MSTVVITCTGDRQQAFTLCQHYHKRFKPVPHMWLVINGPGTGYDLNLYRAFARLPKDVEKIIFMEDDDWYGPNYLTDAVAALDTVGFYGETHAKRYNVRFPSYGFLTNTDTACLATTGFRAEYLSGVLEQLDAQGARAFDSHLWRWVKQQRLPYTLVPQKNVIGMKGLPGRAGLGEWHTAPLPVPDPNFTKLEEWIGKDDAQHYKNIHALAQSSIAPAGDIIIEEVR